MKRTKITQIAVALLAMIALFIGVTTMNAGASLPVGQSMQAASDKAASGKAAVQPVSLGQPTVRTAEHSDVSPPLRTIPLKPALPAQEDNDNPSLPPLRGGQATSDSVVQRLLGPLVMPTPIQNFDGMYNENGPIPPDTNGDVGRNNYVQIVNSMFAVYNKTGTLLYGPANIYTLFTGFGGVCEATNSGDPIVNYDPMADRWVISQFAFFSQSGPTHQCFAVSTSPDPTGSYYRYDFITNPAGFEDYPHVTVWPDAYYMTTNTFNNGANTAGNFAFNRAKMIRGDATAEEVIFRLQGDGGLLSTDFDGSIPPPAGSPNFFFELFSETPGQLAEFKFHVDFTNPALSTFTGPLIIPVADYITTVCGATRGRCVPQPGTTAQLETLSDRLMFRVAYRNMGSYESIVLNHTVNNGSAISAPRWYELRDPNNPVGASVFQQGTYSPSDGSHRWMGSVAQDRAGDIAEGFSASSSTLFPSIRYAGRIPSDPPGTFGQGEATLLAGGGSEDFPAAPRWGDYSNINVDPVDDCTFWFTTEYFAQTGLRNWRTRIGSFKFPGCTPQGSPTPVASPTAPTATSTPVLPTQTPCAGSTVITGAITNSDPTQTGRLGLGGIGATCASPHAVPAVSDTLMHHYRSYTYTNSTGSSQCVTASFVQNCGDNAIQSVAYLGSYNPGSIQTNFLADGGASGHTFSYSFSLAAGQTAVVVVVEVSPNLGCTTYTLTINPCAPPPTATITPTSGATSTPTNTVVTTPTATPTTVCVGTTYQTFTSSGASIITATNDIGNHCDDCATTITLPFTVNVYGTPYTTANVGSNGNLNFNSTQANIFTDNCLPVRANPPAFASTLFAYYDDLRTDEMTATHGIFTNVVGTAPNRQYIIRWQTTYFNTTGDANFEVLLNESSTVLSVVYGSTVMSGTSAAGIQLNLGQYTSYYCHTDPATGTRVDYVPIGCGTPTITLTPTPTSTSTTIATSTIATSTSTSTPGITTTAIGTVTATPTACNMNFTDVQPEDWFYGYVEYLFCRGVVQGYNANPPCVTGVPCFLPNNFTTRGQEAKIVVLAFNMPINTTGGPHFTDVLPAGPTSTFYPYVETAKNAGLVDGYTDPSACTVTGVPCYRPDSQVTRGEVAKIVVNAAILADPAHWTLLNPATNTYQDVPVGSTFFRFIETATAHHVVSGYPCGAPPAPPCIPPGNQNYFIPYGNATRAQISKITYLAVSYPPEPPR